jgi:hypothetical protein
VICRAPILAVSSAAALAALCVLVACTRAEDAPTGVAECDAYLVRYRTCITSMPPSARAGELTALNAQVDAFQRSAVSPAGKASLRQACLRLSDAVATKPGCK